MTHPVLGFEKVFVEYIVVRHMAVVAIGNPSMRPMGPGGILGSHNMAVHTGLRLIRQIRVRLADIKQKEK